MFKMLVLVISVLGLVHSGLGQIIQPGQCESLQQPDFDNYDPATFNPESFAGTWYEIRRSENSYQSGDCSYLEFSGSDSGYQIKYPAVAANFYEETNGTAVHINGTASYTVNLTNVDNDIEFKVLRTDYNNYAVAYSCQNVGANQRALTIWELLRQTSYPNTMIPFLINTTLTVGLDVSVNDLQEIDHSDAACYVLPVIPLGVPVVLPGSCNPNIPVVPNFDPVQFGGLWHEIAAYHSESSQNLCSRAQYTLANGVVQVENSQVIDKALDIITGTATVISADGSAKLSVVLNVGNGTVTTDLWVLATDYDNYAVSYSCENLPNNQQRVYSWILSRSRQISAESQAAVNSVIASEVVLNDAYYKQTDQSDAACFYFPEPDPEKPVVFRGQCNPNIPVIANFNPVAYQGIWHDIESYPSVFQTGACRNADYTLDTTTLVVDVLNTQVLGTTLDVIRGEAVLASTDGSGLLNVTFPIAGTTSTITTNYWILDTDYMSYSLVYSCVNINDDEQQVWLWKLSRSKQLTPAASTTINNIMSNFDIMDQRYLVPVDQSVDGCFYYPEPKPGVPVVFPGQCDPDVPVAQNFNLNQFTGVWYEIEAYPKEQQQGQCISHQYSTGSNNNLNLTSTQVVDQFLTVSEGTFSFATNETSAKMQIDIVVDGAVITIPFWILNIDYNDYALAYSCVNLNQDFRAVYSWKLSRTQQLSGNAIAAMNPIITSVEVLGNEYYEPIDQSLDACFFLPELAPGEPVILVGQCDTNITVVQNFDAARYLGTWRLIESYPTDFQTGTCNQANYAATSISNTISVVNNQVINQTLDTTNGGQAVASADGSGKLLVTFADTTTPAELWILDTDYDTYSLVYSCSNIDDQTRRIWSWKMSRTPSLSQNAITAINQVVNSIQVLNNAYYYQVDHSDAACFYYPEPDFSASGVLFRGQCDESINTVQNFSVVDYLGTWRNVELYPSNFQEGTCNTAEYSLGDGVVNVLNSQVIDLTLDTINGIAAVSSTDGSAKLTVTFPGPNGTTVETPLWVLDTDYSSYSLTYTCVNVDEYYRQVWSWKLSRTRELTPQAIAAIQNTSENIEVLAPQYYQLADHTDDGCFYYPEPVAAKPVRFPGQCSNNVSVVQNFNLDLFEGTWYEIQAYPKMQQQGECVSHQYTTGLGNTLNLQSLNVINKTLGVTDGVFNFTSTDNSAKMSITIIVDGNEIVIPFWIVDTDYSNYALAYACENDGPDYRYVYSWKLSRTKELSANAVTAINNAIANVDVLSNQYYEDIDQSDDACFFLPEVLPGEEVIFPGSCENITVVQNFNAAAYTGRWFLIESYPAADQQSGTCNDATYTAGANNVVNVLNTQVVNQTLVTVSGTAVVASTDGSGKLLVTFPNNPTPGELWILDTDYTSYSLAYSCRDINSDQRAVFSWKLSRERTLSANAVTAINQVINSVNVLDERYYYEIDHSEEACFYFPEPDFSSPVRFRGRCNQNISVVQDFDAAKYLGVWHNIELYPTGFQEGQCNNALYSLGNDGVIVFNTEVVNQTLSTITGLAVPVSNDGSAILDVSFPTTNLTTPYWVLATDYVSYSLVYSCIEIDDEYKNVWSWKLSRTKQLTPTAVSAINNAISQVQVLAPQYYKTANQSPEACFYYPEPQPGQVVRFPGKCDPNIPVEQNFNLTMFEGIWHEIQAYPKEQQQGQCVNHEYIAGSGNYLELVSSSISNLTMALTNGNLSFTSTDNSGKLSITITNSNGQVINIPFWILDTDYSNYALAYACVDEETVNDMDYRRVFSWKLSRTKSLSPAASATIDSVIDSVDVLSNIYYEDIDQSDDACFYLPDYVEGEPVIFPGQCDLNLPVVQSFNASRYLGRWRTIELYHADFNTGECSEAQYSPLANGNVEVVNSHVIAQTLFSTNAVAVPASDSSAKWEVTFSNSATPIPYWVLDTDYDSYSLVYTCSNINAEQRRVVAWKLSRDRELSPAASAAIDQVINTVNVLDNKYFREMVQNDDACFYYPEADGSPVIFRGQCDDNITVVSNFDATKYQGTWYDIESYPAGFQDGTCNTAQYTLNGGVVEVFNTQVVDQELDTITATAVPAFTDGSAKLIVTFPAGPGSTIDVPYWVLDTDYDSYSLVYSCENIDDERRRVTSWKLSRSQYLTNASSTAINAVVNTVPVLAQQYYIERDHSYDGCFYYPDNFGGPIIYNDGACPLDNQVNTVQNFDADKFAGTWHEVERFPSQQSGTCTASAISIGSNGSSTLTQTFVVNERQESLIGSAVVAANGSGIIAISVTNGQVNINNNFYIIDTDYDNYALLYACTTLTNSSRQVFSWKLSRTRDGFSPAVIEHIDNIVRDEVDLHRSYYDAIPQDDDACFYYPIFDELPNSIQLPGPCPNITGVANFNLPAYVGRWFDVERYPQPNQQGTCNRARYEELSPTTFSVLNYQVLGTAGGPSLSTISGNATIMSTDGTGALTVTLQNGQLVSTLYVLDTDYSSYAFLYNCRNLENGWRQVASWKLSRTPSLTTATQNAINNVINSTQGLIQDYYKPTNQSEEACFFIPAFNPNQRPEFRASCGSITGMQDFDINKYQGWWHEYESYAADGERGQCGSARYEVSGSSVQYVGTEVFGLLAQLTTASVTVHPGGRLEKTLSNGQVENLWVLDTDYETYSVVISCETVDDEFARVWSAKYRKTPTLTDAIVSATDAVVASHPLLYQHLFQTMDQSETACFHLPQPNSERVVLRGQCDQNIPVQNNFEIGDYTGTWYQIERYPYPEVSADSTCIGAQYTLQEGTDVVTVLNWEVSNGELQTIEGLGTVVGNAKIQVQLPTPGLNQTSTQDLYILSTDYVSYSLAYTCENISPFERVVVAFKLSRTRTLPAAGASAIDAVVGTRPELHQPFFIPVPHDDDCDEPSASYWVKSSVVLIMLCYVAQMIL